MEVPGIEWTNVLFNIHLITLLSECIALIFLPDKIKPLFAAAAAFLVSGAASLLALTALSNNGIETLFTLGSFIGNVPLRIDPHHEPVCFYSEWESSDLCGLWYRFYPDHIYRNNI